MKKVALFIFAFCVINANSQIISTIVGLGLAGYSGDGGLATGAKINSPCGIGTDTVGNIYIADDFNHVIRKLTKSTGVITTIAGTGISGYSGDGGLAINAKIYYPGDVSCDKYGNIYIADQNNNAIRKISIATGIITTVAGNGSQGYSGDGGPATSAQLKTPLGVTVDKFSNIYIADANNHCIRKVDGGTGIITTIAGNGTLGFSGDGGLASLALVNHPSKVILDSIGNLYFTDEANNRVRKIMAGTNIIQTIAGTGTFGYSGDGGLATSAQFSFPIGLAFDAIGNLYIADIFNNRIRKMAVSTNIITTVAGNGTVGYSGDGGISTSAQLKYPQGILIDKYGNLCFSEYGNHIVRIVNDINLSVDEDSSNRKEIKIYPNPNSGSFTLKIDNEIENCEITLINILGQKVHAQKISQGQNNIITHDLTSGLYTYIVTFDKGQVINGKLKIE